MIDLDCIGAPAFVVEVLPNGEFRYADVNAACRLKVRISEGAFSGRTPQECQEPSHAARILLGDLPMASSDRLTEGKAESEVVLIRFRKNSGEVCWAECRRMAVQDAGQRRVCGVIIDVAEERRRGEGLLDLASSDALTGLFNRRGFERETERASVAAFAGQRIALLLIDLDRFKSTDDTFGHPASDAVLAEDGRRLSSGLGLEAVCARIGGDEFIAPRTLQPGETPETLRAAIVSALERPLVHQGRRLPLEASVGFASARGGFDVGELMARADSALYAEKRARRRRPTLAA